MTRGTPADPRPPRRGRIREIVGTGRAALAHRVAGSADVSDARQAIPKQSLVARWDAVARAAPHGHDGAVA